MSASDTTKNNVMNEHNTSMDLSSSRDQSLPREPVISMNPDITKEVNSLPKEPTISMEKYINVIDLSLPGDLSLPRDLSSPSKQISFEEDTYKCRHAECKSELFKHSKSRYRHEHSVIHSCPLESKCICCSKMLMRKHRCITCNNYTTTRRDNLAQHRKSCHRKMKIKELLDTEDKESMETESSLMNTNQNTETTQNLVKELNLLREQSKTSIPKEDTPKISKEPNISININQSNDITVPTPSGYFANDGSRITFDPNKYISLSGSFTPVSSDSFRSLNKLRFHREIGIPKINLPLNIPTLVNDIVIPVPIHPVNQYKPIAPIDDNRFISNPVYSSQYWDLVEKIRIAMNS